MNILLTIAARGGSKGVKNKNIRPLCGKPLLAHTIEQALKWGKASHVVVTTESEDIARVAREYGAEVPFMRPAEMATDTASKIPPLRHAFMTMEQLTGEHFDFLIDLDPTSPIRRGSDIDGAVALFLERRPKVLFSVTPARKNPYFNMVEIDEQGRAHVSKTLSKTPFRRQDSPNVYSINASIYGYSRDFILDPGNVSVMTDHSVAYVMSELSGVDIDGEVDFRFVEFLVKEKIWNFE